MNWGKVSAISEEPLSGKLKEAYPSVFNGKGVIKTFKADVKVQPNVNPRFCRARPVPYALREAVEKEIDRLEKEWIIRKVEKSDLATPIVVVPKANKSVRLCGDFKVTVNPVLEENIYPLPTDEDLFAKMGGATLFSKLDLSSAYLQLELTEKSRPLLVINTHKGLYEFQRLCFGISTAPSIFQSVMDQVLQGIPHVEYLLDDIPIGTVTEKQHDVILHQVLKHLDTYGIKVNMDKCKFKVRSVDYLGHHIDGNGFHPMKEKIQAITEAPHPKNITELRAFLGMINFYSRVLREYVYPAVTTVSSALSRHGLEVDDQARDVFQKCKTMLSSESVLVHYDMNKSLTLACDASAYGVGCYLSHLMDDGSERPISYASRTLSSS
ncbi:uncharacterized protein K02A2.6-like [Haliotis rubra]|uniref:uncharacterized protein K02A2.6-like n=1 Tax=Haliotis rubra TaxID=36100 RepID=UPI001EE53869|nr:uncharacterized protein K02A2.6-like [Haliotis rubra]